MTFWSFTEHLIYRKRCDRENGVYTVSQKTSPTISTVTWKPIIRFW